MGFAPERQPCAEQLPLPATVSDSDARRRWPGEVVEPLPQPLQAWWQSPRRRIRKAGVSDIDGKEQRVLVRPRMRKAKASTPTMAAVVRVPMKRSIDREQHAREVPGQASVRRAADLLRGLATLLCRYRAQQCLLRAGMGGRRTTSCGRSSNPSRSSWRCGGPASSCAPRPRMALRTFWISDRLEGGSGVAFHFASLWQRRCRRCWGRRRR